MARLRIETVPEITVKDEAFVIKAASGATAPLIQFKNSAGTVVGSLTITGELSIDSLAVSNAGNGSGSLATRGYVDSLAAGLNWHDSVAYATAAVLPASTYSNGTLGVGATLTGNANGRLTVDGSSQTTGESILVKNQASATQNGIYLITAQGDSSNPFILTRRTDSNNSIVGQVSSGDSVYVVSGSTNGGQGFTLTSVGTGTAGVIIFGTDSLTFTQFTGTSAFVSGAGLATTGNTINIGTASSSRIIINEDNIDLATVEQTNTSGSSTTSFINAITVDSYGRITGKQSSSVSFAGYALLASPTFTGTVTIPSGASISGFAPLASPTFTGTVTVPTPTNNTDAVTKAYVDSGVASATTATLNDVGDVTITSPAAGQTIQWNGSAWVNVTPTGTTVTTTANRSTDIPSPFTGQLIVLTDTKKVQLWDGTAWLNITMAPPETPTSLSAIEAPTSVAISFTAGAANGSAITNYKYALSTDGGSTYGSYTALSPADFTTPITVSGLSMNTAYYVKLKAVNDLGDSVASAAVTFTTEGVPGAPTSLSASSVTGSTANIAFTAGAANGASITNYKFAVSTDNITYGAYTALDPVDASTPITVTGLTSGTAQYIKLKAVNSNGDSPASAAVSFTTLAAPSAPTSLSAGSVGAYSVVISFTAGDQGGDVITNYQYALSTDSGSTYGSFTALATPDATTPVTITGLSDLTNYYLKLKAVNQYGNSPASSAVSFTTLVGVDYLILGGGGGGGYDGGGGGGAGGYINSYLEENSGGNTASRAAIETATGTTHTVTVGNGGGGNGGTGGNSVFSNLTAYGGDGAGPWHVYASAAAGGAYQSPVQGYPGTSSGSQNGHHGGGGGGSGGIGHTGAGNNSTGTGGIGLYSSISGTSVIRGGGGGGGSISDGVAGGGSGGGGSGGGGAGGTNLGGGGGGGGVGHHTHGGGGGSGTVILSHSVNSIITVGAGLTYSQPSVAGRRVAIFTSGSGSISFS